MMWAEQFHPLYRQTSQNIPLSGPGNSEFEKSECAFEGGGKVCVWHPQNLKAYPDRHQKEEMTLII